jgi:hypothetical protein
LDHFSSQFKSNDYLPKLLTIDDENVSDEENIAQLDGINDLHPTMNQAAGSKHTHQSVLVN